MGDKTVTTKTEVPPMTPEELQMIDLGIDYMLQGQLADQFYIKKSSKTRYENQSLVDALNREKEGYSRELEELTKSRSQINQTMNQGGQLGMNQFALQGRDMDIRSGELRTKIAGIDSKIKKESEKSTTYDDITLLDKPPPAIRRKLLDLQPYERDQAEDILSNYGYSSKEFKNWARKVKMPPKEGIT